MAAIVARRMTLAKATGSVWWIVAARRAMDGLATASDAATLSGMSVLSVGRPPVDRLLR